ncbi:uncharacterized protein DS421_1g10840 [Arachis hypogaea]|nr:uncharacterized protein DS421_1g10840 [Arachis hypogaea]
MASICIVSKLLSTIEKSQHGIYRKYNYDKEQPLYNLTFPPGYAPVGILANYNPNMKNYNAYQYLMNNLPYLRSAHISSQPTLMIPTQGTRATPIRLPASEGRTSIFS